MQFDYMHDSSSLWIWRNLQAIDENGSSDSSIEPNVCEWDRILNYPLQDGHSFKCSLYDTPLKQEVQADAHARMPVRAMSVLTYTLYVHRDSPLTSLTSAVWASGMDLYTTKTNIPHSS